MGAPDESGMDNTMYLVLQKIDTTLGKFIFNLEELKYCTFLQILTYTFLIFENIIFNYESHYRPLKRKFLGIFQ